MDDGDDMDVSLDGATPKRACDSCRSRKIRCDRSVPCSHCRTTCTTTAPTQKAQRHRVHISEEYEKKIDRIEDRLASIENMFANLATKLGVLDIQTEPSEMSNQSQSSRLGVNNKSPVHIVDTTTPAPFEGETTINSQSDYARELLAQAISSNSSIKQNAEIRSALTALGDLVSQQGQHTSSTSPLTNRSLAEFDLAKMDRPPWDEVRNALDKGSNNPTMAFANIFPFLKLQNLKDILEDAYYNPGYCSAARSVLAYGIMQNLFTEFKDFPLPGQDVSNYATYAVLCKRLEEVAMSQLEISMLASYENIMALVLGATHAIELCKPSLSWAMISSAAGLCQSLGYHRIDTMSSDSVEERNSKIHIFWMIYMLDKTLSLRLGRASVIQDWDISLPFIFAEKSTGGSDGNRMLAYWVKVARVQGQLYEKLFCPAAFLKSSEERTQIAIELVNAMNLAWFERGEATTMDFTSIGEPIESAPQRNSSPNETQIPSQRERMPLDANEYVKGSFELVQDLFFHSDVVVYYSTCALIQRAVNTDNVIFNQECLESSRAALTAHMRANSQFNKKGNEEIWSGYIHWSILQAPFTPFIVIFCNAIQNTDPSDLDSLSDFVTSLESSRTISEGADRLYKMCLLFLHVAKLYIRFKTQDTSSQSQNVAQSGQSNYYTTMDGTQVDLNAITSFDPYLSALGLIPNSAWPMAGYSNAPTSAGGNILSHGQGIGGTLDPHATELGFGPPGGNQNSIQDWFSGSRYLMNFMEAGDDLQMPDLDF